MKKKIDPSVVLVGYETEEAILKVKVERASPSLPPRKRARCLVRLSDLRNRFIPEIKRGMGNVVPPPRESVRERRPYLGYLAGAEAAVPTHPGIIN